MDMQTFLDAPRVTHDVEIGSAEWLKHRQSLFNSSDAAAMMGVSPYKTRGDLIREMATGVVAEPDDFAQGLFAEGHRVEALARPVAEGLLGEMLYPQVFSKGRLGASVDGQVMSGKKNWEHKLLNEMIREFIPEGEGIADGVEFPMLYAVQMEQQFMAAGGEACLFSATRWEGERLVEARHAWYYSNPALQKRIVAGWAQAYADALAWVPVEIVEPVKVARKTVNLPALFAHVKGEVSSTNFPEFKAAALAYVAGINEKLDTDLDFGQAENDVRFCEETEKKIEMLKTQILEQAADVNTLITGLTDIGESFRTKRLALDKKTKTRKVERKVEIAAKAQKSLDEHVALLNTGLAKPWLQTQRGNWDEAMKRKQSIAGLQEGVDVELAEQKVQASQKAATLAANAKTVDSECEANWTLFVDFAVLGLNPPEMFRAVALQRHADAKERERKADEAKQAAALAAAPPVAAPAPLPAAAVVGSSVFANIPTVKRPAATRPPLSTKDVCDLLGFEVTVSYLEALGFAKIERPEGKKTGSYWKGDDFQMICARIAEQLQRAVQRYTGAA